LEYCSESSTYFDFVIFWIQTILGLTLDFLQGQKRLGKFQEEANCLLANQVVFTRYNKKTYTIGGVEMAKSLNSPYKADGTGETFLGYYKRVLLFVFVQVIFFLKSISSKCFF
jgi:hypothetical protein